MRAAIRATVDLALAAEPVMDPACGDLAENGVDEDGLDFDGCAAKSMESLDRPHDRRFPGSPIETVESKVVAEDVRDAPLETIELGESVLAERDQDVDPQRLREHAGQRVLEGAALRVVEEVLLCLVEHEVDIAVNGLGSANRVTKRPHVDAGLVPRLRAPALPPDRRPQFENTTTSGCSGSSRNARATPACRSDDLPTPLGP